MVLSSLKVMSSFEQPTLAASSKSPKGRKGGGQSSLIITYSCRQRPELDQSISFEKFLVDGTCGDMVAHAVIWCFWDYSVSFGPESLV